VGCHPQEQGGPRAVLQRPRFPEWPFGVLIMLSDFVKVLFTWKGQIQNKPFPFPLGWHHILCQWIYRHSFWMLNCNSGFSMLYLGMIPIVPSTRGPHY
jgi:hypothetical protein